MGKISSKERRSNAISVTTFEKNGNIINWKKCTLLRPGLLSRLTNSLCSLLHYYWWASKSFQFFFFVHSRFVSWHAFCASIMRHNNDFYFSLNLHLGLCVLDGPVWLQRIYISIMCQQQRRRWHAMKKKMQSLLRHIFDTFPYISIAAAVVILHIDQKESPELNCTHYSEKKKREKR